MKFTFLQYKALRPWLWRWHRRLGLAAALIVVLVSVTGIMLNHTSELNLAKKAVNHQGLLSYYGMERPSLKSFQLDGQWLTGDTNGQLYLNDQMIGQCRGQLISAVLYQKQYWLACDQELMVFSLQAELLDKITALYGLPTPVKAMGLCESALCLSTEQRVFELDTKQIAFTPRPSKQLQIVVSDVLPEDIEQRLVNQYLGQGLSLERVILDLHSGRLFGKTGVWVFDIAALLLLFLALSGFVLWYQQQQRKKSRQSD